MSTNRFYFAALVATATLSGCASMPQNSVLDEARSDYQAAQANPQVVELAPYELKQAGDALSKATDAASNQDDAAKVSHLAYLAKQRTAIAQETARQKAAEETVANAAKERGDIRLEARTAEVDKAQQQAALSRMQSEISQEQARDAEMRTSQLEAELRELNAKQTERGLVITLGDVLFDTNKAQLKAGGVRSLEKLAGFLKQYPQRNVKIEGYTDSTGSADYNLGLSDRRANAVRSSLLDMGINSDRITTRGYGQESPVAGNDTAMGRQLNRRVEIVLSDENGGATSR